MNTVGRQAGWRKSTHSDFDNNCVEVEFTEAGVARIRDTKVADSPVIAFTAEQWSRWLAEVVADEMTGTNGAVRVTAGPPAWTVCSIANGATLVFDGTEWTAFRLAAVDGQFDPATVLAGR